MDPLIIYLVFAITTGICSWLFFYLPTIKEALSLGIDNTFTRNPVISSITFFCLSACIAPSIFIPIFSEEKSQLFRKGLREEMLKQD